MTSREGQRQGHRRRLRRTHPNGLAVGDGGEQERAAWQGLHDAVLQANVSLSGLDTYVKRHAPILRAIKELQRRSQLEDRVAMLPVYRNATAMVKTLTEDGTTDPVALTLAKALEERIRRMVSHHYYTIDALKDGLDAVERQCQVRIRAVTGKSPRETDLQTAIARRAYEYIFREMSSLAGRFGALPEPTVAGVSRLAVHYTNVAYVGCFVRVLDGEKFRKSIVKSVSIVKSKPRRKTATSSD